MKSNQTENEPSGLQLLRLVNTQLPQIIRKEQGNETRIRLYGAGEYWSAFEQSAYLLCQLFPHSNMTIWTHKDYPFTVVMASISDEELRAYSRRTIFGRDLPDYKEFICRKTSSVPYHIWHRNEVQQFSEGLDIVHREQREN